MSTTLKLEGIRIICDALLLLYHYYHICSVQKTYLRLLTIGLALAPASAQLQDSNIPPAGRVAGGDILSHSVL